MIHQMSTGCVIKGLASLEKCPSRSSASCPQSGPATGAPSEKERSIPATSIRQKHPTLQGRFLGFP